MQTITAVHGAKSSKQYGVPVGTKIQARGFYKSGQDPKKDLIVLSMIHGQDFASFSVYLKLYTKRSIDYSKDILLSKSMLY